MKPGIDVHTGDLVFNIWRAEEPLIVLGPAYPPSRAGELPHLTRYQIASVICLKPNGTTESINRNNLKPSKE
jgi:hypothetical protein